MKKFILIVGILVAALALFMSGKVSAQTNTSMRMNAGIITARLQETKTFYTSKLGFTVVFENEFYLLLQTPGGNDQISFLLPNHPTQQRVFQMAFGGSGVYLTIEVHDVDAVYKQIQALGVPIEIAIRNEDWGDRHFAIKDPNGIGIDIVTYTKP
ncbi:MAG TPA: VOC family protein [Cyclobacteriaceae bacterium]|nr:VOC family protein [Cyclobacteriaceae bacterium]HMV08403.1 VOC family protein [Cyclobacteriaceae bacterium]HMV89670.1 VOC family protein [Cyclobacteriaceae bacterium]HMX50579.1 VOC family protein [Cyclobacteriaceae bacterium]HMY91978.1 VOC family protein [Cyclobacteriaceae bacterium]